MSAQKITILSMREVGDSSDDVLVFKGHRTKEDLALEIDAYVQDYIRMVWKSKPCGGKRLFSPRRTINSNRQRK